MNEKDILLLQGLGYQVTDHGAIIDGNGNYLEEVVYKGQVIESFQTKSEYLALQQRKAKLEEIGFKEDANSPNNLYTQQEIAITKNQINKYLKDTTSVQNPYLNDSPYYQAAIKEIELENNQIKSDFKVSVKDENQDEQIDKDSNDVLIVISVTLLVSLIVLLLVKYIKKVKSFRFYIIITALSFLVSTYFGFKYKELSNEYFLRKASLKKTEWQKDAYLDYVKSQDSFFELNGYSFCWEWFLFTFLGLLLLAIVIRNTIFYDRIKSFIKSIRR
ncbi:hypothetical protein [Winogradskyella bathintestinalis]|uniref:Uncharacterized protein n=1 Tax=Winogradskyella bathintestinalis TaxID=3035208 RepID=A0ABT7ZQI7_9FLAO|nr:hypothetical protein [Winogradskyella bathintestinalis]MDN3491272.1 hypothetical protein [Winogradskyella bathintestinalis]